MRGVFRPGWRALHDTQHMLAAHAIRSDRPNNVVIRKHHSVSVYHENADFIEGEFKRTVSKVMRQ
jgi:ribosomal protein S24E